VLGSINDTLDNDTDNLDIKKSIKYQVS